MVSGFWSGEYKKTSFQYIRQYHKEGILEKNAAFSAIKKKLTGSI